MTILYVSCAERAEIEILGLDTGTGALSRIATATAPAGITESGTSMALAMRPDGQVLYSAVRSPPLSACSFAIDSTNGTLRSLGIASLTEQMAYIVTDRTGRHLLAASYHGSKIASYCIDPDGQVRAPATQILDTPPKAHSILPDPTNRFVYSATLGGDAILRMAFDAATGRLTPLAPMATQPGSGPRHLRFAPSGNFLYLINELGGTINAYAFSASDGSLREIQSITVLPDGAKITGSAAAADIHLTPDGRFLYGSVRSTDTLAGFRVDIETGLLSPVGSVASEAAPRGFAIDPSGQFLLCAGQNSNRVGVYAIDATNGMVTLVGGLAVGGNPNWIEFSPR